MKVAAVRASLAGLVAGVFAGLLVAVPTTYFDWRLNPSGIFRDESGTRWSIVFDTVLSWFWPVAVIVFFVVAALRYLILRRRQCST